MITNASRLSFAKQDIRRLFVSYGRRDYIGEDGVSQLSHAFQTAFLTHRSLRVSNVSLNIPINHLIVAGWLHDIGQLKSFEQDNTTRSAWGVHKHEHIGSQYLESLGFPQSVVRLVEYHVKAKRYMVTTDEKYRSTLSTASLATLDEQGGKLSEQEVRDFRADTLFHAALLLRLSDDKAKQPIDVIDVHGAFDYVWNLVEGK